MHRIYRKIYIEKKNSPHSNGTLTMAEPHSLVLVYVLVHVFLCKLVTLSHSDQGWHDLPCVPW